MRRINGTAGDTAQLLWPGEDSFRQHYRLAFWQTASDSINYRRFFSITDLVGVRVEDPAVFDATHEAIIRAGLSRVSRASESTISMASAIRAAISAACASVCLQMRTARDGAYLMVEKILARDEPLPADWPIEGTTGYDYLNYANRLLGRRETERGRP